MATENSSGIAVQQEKELQAGVQQFNALLESIRDINNETCGVDGSDGRDYAAIARCIETSIKAHLEGTTGPSREGYLRALADCFSLTADGCVGWDEGRDPIEVTAAAFAKHPTVGQANWPFTNGANPS